MLSQRANFPLSTDISKSMYQACVMTISLCQKATVECCRSTKISYDDNFGTATALDGLFA